MFWFHHSKLPGWDKDGNFGGSGDFSRLFFSAEERYAEKKSFFSSRLMSPPTIASPDITWFASTDFRDQPTRFGIKATDRRFHIFTLGKTGTGKSTLMETFMRQDMMTGRGFALLDPHGDLVEKLLPHLPAERAADLIYFNVPDPSTPWGFNPLGQVHPTKRALAAAGLLEVFKKLWPEFWGPRSEHILRNALLALLDYPTATLADVLRLLQQHAFRRAVLKTSQNPQVREFWFGEYEKYPARLQLEAIAPLQNKIGAFLSDPLLNRILTQTDTRLKLRQVMDEGKILLVNLAKGKIGDDTASLLGSMLVSRLGLAALSRADIPEEERRDFTLYVDEVWSFSTLSFANMLAEARKFRLSLFLSTQMLASLDPRIREAILGNVGTLIAFRLGVHDAEELAKEFYPTFSAQDVLNLPNYHIYLKLMIDGQVSAPFSAVTLPPQQE